MATTIRPDIILTEGTLHNVVISVPTDILLDDYNAKIQVRKAEGSEVVLEFSTLTGTTLTKNEQLLLLDIHSNLTEGLSGVYKWQLMLYSNEDNAIKFPAYNFIVQPAITI